MDIFRTNIIRSKYIHTGDYVLIFYFDKLKVYFHASTLFDLSIVLSNQLIHTNPHPYLPNENILIL